MIEFKNIAKSYHNLNVLKDLNFTIEDHQLTVIIGPSGCGKSTSLKLINRMIQPTKGEILIDGKNILKMNPQVLRRSIGYVIQQVGLFPHLTVEKNIGVVPRLLKWDKAKIKQRTEQMLKLINLDYDQYAHKFPHQLSGGEAQRVGVARALAGDPPLLLMDEPFAAVDPITRQKLQNQFMRIQKELKKTILFITHDIDEAIKLADKIIILNKGQIVQYDTPEKILKKPINKFVHDFIGSDRALKRLSRLTVEEYIGETKGIRTQDITATPLEQIENDFSWLIDHEDKLCGWFNKMEARENNDVNMGIYQSNPEEIAVKMDMTLRDAFSYMLEQGFQTIAVVDDKGKLLGEISLQLIEKIIFLGNKNAAKK
ncbi:MAG: ABC transporter ATP-binding protein [Spirochaetes bacterium]|nr:ABC transporter ATP-binding protein [Spirochaetota bacterium]